MRLEFSVSRPQLSPGLSSLIDWLFLLFRHPKYITGKDEGKSAFVIWLLNLGHCAVVLMDNLPKVVALLYRTSGIIRFFG